MVCQLHPRREDQARGSTPRVPGSCAKFSVAIIVAHSRGRSRHGFEKRIQISKSAGVSLYVVVEPAEYDCPSGSRIPDGDGVRWRNLSLRVVHLIAFGQVTAFP